MSELLIIPVYAVRIRIESHFTYEQLVTPA